MSTDKKRYLPMIFMLLLAPALGELLSGSSPPREYFRPFSFLILTILYGGGALLIREAMVRWKLGWSVMFLAIAYGIIEEGLMVQSFFNHNHVDLGAIAFYGRWMGTNWPWTIELTAFHATVSTMVPILATDLLFPYMKNKPFLKIKGIKIWIIAFVINLIFFAGYIIIEFSKLPNPYIANPIQLMLWIVITGMLIFLAYRFRNKFYIEEKRKIKSPTTFFVLSFVFQFLNVLLPFALKDFNLPAVVCVALQIVLSIVAILFVFRQIYSAKITIRHKIALVSGTVYAFVGLIFFGYSTNKDLSMVIVGILSIILIFVFRAFVIKENNNSLVKQLYKG